MAVNKRSKCLVNYTNGVTICHGKSELHLSRYITTNLHLAIKAYSKNSGEHSIQINSLMSVLNGTPFKSRAAFLNEYDVETQGKGRDTELKNFKLFIIMDTDDCDDSKKEEFKSGKMFSGHWLSKYIVPIYSIPALEDAMKEAKIITKQIKDAEKDEFYSKIFPINKKAFSEGTLEEIQLFRTKIESCVRTNLVQYVDYCLSLVK